MNCIICNEPMKYFFQKQFNDYDLDKVEYYKCTSCGFCNSKTHYELSKSQWKKLNEEFHNDNNDRGDNPWNRNQRYFNQSLMIQLMKKVGLIADSKYLDWGSGIGSVSKLSRDFFDTKISNFDKYITPDLNNIKLEEKDKRKFVPLGVKEAQGCLEIILLAVVVEL